MKKALVVFIGLLIVLSGWRLDVAAAEDDQVFVAPSGEEFAVAQPAEEVQVEEVNSFEMFWPIVAGKTRADSLYGLKRLKENARGWVIFGKTQKASYKVFLGLKRSLEAEKLLMNEEEELATEALEDARRELSEANLLLEKARESNPDATVDQEAYTRLENLKTFLHWLSEKGAGDEFRNLTGEILMEVENLL